MHLRAAKPDDIPLLRRWDAADHVRAAGILDWEWEDMLSDQLDWRALLIAEQDDRPVGFVQIIDPAADPSGYWGHCGAGLRAIDIWIGESDLLGQGLGTQMMQQALRLCFAPSDVRAVVIDPLTSNTAAHRFYRRLGFTFVEQRQFDQNDCSVFELTRAAWRNGV